MYRIDTIDNRIRYRSQLNYLAWSAYERKSPETEAVSDFWGFIKGIFGGGK